LKPVQLFKLYRNSDYEDNVSVEMHKKRRMRKDYLGCVCKRSSGWIYCDNYVHITQSDAKTVPNRDVSFVNGELHQA